MLRAGIGLAGQGEGTPNLSSGDPFPRKRVRSKLIVAVGIDRWRSLLLPGAENGLTGNGDGNDEERSVFRQHGAENLTYL